MTRTTQVRQPREELNDARPSPGLVMQRGGLASAVHHYLDGDAPAREMLARGVLSLRAMARWLIEQEGWVGATEEAVVSALRRYPARERDSRMTGARKIMTRSHVNTRANVCSLVLPKTAEAHRALADVVLAVDPSRGEMVRIAEGERAITVILDRINMEAVRRALAVKGIRYTTLDLVEHTLICPEEGRETPGILALVFNSLAANGVNVVAAMGTYSEHLVFVEERDSRVAFQVLTRLTRGR